MWLRLYPEQVEADLARYPDPRDDLLEFYRGRLSARRLFVLIRGLGRESATVQADLARDGAPKPESAPDRHLAPVRCLADVPVAKSMAEVGKFVNARGEELAGLMGETG